MIHPKNRNMKEKEKISIIDANIFLTGIDFNLFNDFLYTTPNIIEEIEVKKFSEKNRNILHRIQAAIESGKLFIRVPTDKYFKIVEEKSKITGDFKALSFADKELIALTLELIETKGVKAKIYTNDYSMENLCNELGLDYTAIHRKGIEKKILWEVYCPFCKISYKPEYLYQKCDRCGSPLKRRPKNNG